MSETLARIPLDRRVCIVQSDRIDLRPERAAIVGPTLGLIISAALFAAMAFWSNHLPLGPLAVMLLAAIILTPFSGMAFVYSLIGAAVVIEKRKQSVRFHQGVLGLGLGTYELVPFWKIERIEVEDFKLGETSSRTPRPPLDLRAWDIVLVKVSGKRLPIGQVISANNDELIDEGFDRALDAAEAIAAMVEKPIVITAATEEEAGAAGDGAKREPSARASP